MTRASLHVIMRFSDQMLREYIRAGGIAMCEHSEENEWQAVHMERR